MSVAVLTFHLAQTVLIHRETLLVRGLQVAPVRLDQATSLPRWKTGDMCLENVEEMWRDGYH